MDAVVCCIALNEHKYITPTEKKNETKLTYFYTF